MPNLKCHATPLVYCCSQTNACYCYMQNLTTVTLTQDLVNILIRFCTTQVVGSRAYIFRLRLLQNPFFDSDSDKLLFSTPTLTSTPRKNLRLRLCNTDQRHYKCHLHKEKAMGQGHYLAALHKQYYTWLMHDDLFE